VSCKLPEANRGRRRPRLKGDKVRIGFASSEVTKQPAFWRSCGRTFSAPSSRARLRHSPKKLNTARVLCVFSPHSLLSTRACGT